MVVLWRLQQPSGKQYAWREEHVEDGPRAFLDPIVAGRRVAFSALQLLDHPERCVCLPELFEAFDDLANQFLPMGVFEPSREVDVSPANAPELDVGDVDKLEPSRVGASLVVVRGSCKVGRAVRVIRTL